MIGSARHPPGNDMADLHSARGQQVAVPGGEPLRLSGHDLCTTDQKLIVAEPATPDEQVRPAILCWLHSLRAAYCC